MRTRICFAVAMCASQVRWQTGFVGAWCSSEGSLPNDVKVITVNDLH